MTQISIFDGAERFKITKPVRLIELFAGIGAQAKALERLGVDFEHYRVCEFDKYAIKSYNAIHGTDGKISKANGKVIGEFVCNNIGVVTWCSNVTPSSLKEFYNKETCLTDEEVWEYTKGKSFYEWHISNLVIYDKPRELSEFITPTDCNSGTAKSMLCNTCCLSANFCSKKPKRITRPPQSWCYVESEE